ncbi:MAG: branched-chain amino acid aminotransferase [Nanoarchaeota archaeon]|nr:branched-chain amino acid aminotransferase [Nanoarchaeota archaeon]
MKKKDLDWKNLGFNFFDTNSHVEVEYKDGRWGEIKVKKDPYLPMHVAANCFNYGQACFEGIKAFTTKDGDTVIFRPEENAKRIRKSAERLDMKAPPVETFVEAVKLAVKENLDYVPPYGYGASLYIRPVLLGTEPQILLTASKTFKFFVFVIPVGPLYSKGFLPVRTVVVEDYDRAAPQGTGMTKMSGNYAAGMKPDRLIHEQGYSIGLFLDPKEKKYIDEFGTSNFIGITKDSTYMTPKSPSILPSITNNSLKKLAGDMGMTVAEEKIPINDIDRFAEVGACGTAAVITPVYSVTYKGKEHIFGDKDAAGPTLTKLYKEFQGIQYGEIDDRHNWMTKVD